MRSRSCSSWVQPGPRSSGTRKLGFVANAAVAQPLGTAGRSECAWDIRTHKNQMLPLAVAAQPLLLLAVVLTHPNKAKVSRW